MLELDLSRKADVTVNGTPGTLKDLGAGQTAEMTYNSELEIVTKVVAKGMRIAVPELAVILELNSAGEESHLWLSSNGLTIGWVEILTW